MHIEARGDCIWEIAREGGMHVPGRVLASPALMDELRGDVTLQQVVNVAHLPGIVGYSWAMPDAHLGYGFPIGGVAATVPERGGVISPGGVGYDINCGVRLATLNLTRSELLPRIERLVSRLFETLPCGAHPHQSGTGDLSADEMRRVLRDGAAFAVQRGFGADVDLEHSEEEGAMRGADPAEVSDAAIERGRRQLGSVGSGNHFVEVGCVSRVFEPEVARVLGLAEDSVTVMIHCGSRGLGHQVCTDFLREMGRTKFPYSLPDRQLACAPVDSDLGRRYLAAMSAAANYAWANRQVLMVLAARAFSDVFGAPVERLGFRLVYDICHNIAKMETHDVDGQRRRVCVHRKGATRALPPGDARIPLQYRGVGQPVLIPGDMGRASYVCVGAQFEGEHPFHSSCHGAGRRLSRRAATRAGEGRSITDELRKQGVVAMAKDRRTLAEEMPEAYKNVADVVDVMHRVGLIRRVVEIKPVGVIKG
jgi:tRNA-splicing ligase RtcB (3'-phosphate/5'-hydroxy nucleic acid ligase)